LAASEIIRTNAQVILGTKARQPDTGDLLLPYQRRRNPNSLTEKHASQSMLLAPVE
jgi:hypothetical protein